MKDNLFILLGVIGLVVALITGIYPILQEPESPSFKSLDITEVNVIGPPRYSAVNSYREGLAPAKIEKKWGYIDIRGQWKIEPRYEAARAFSQERAAVRVRGKWGFISNKGDWFVKPQFQDARSFRNNRAAVKKEGQWTFIDDHGELIAPFKFDTVRSFSDGLAVVSSDSKKGYINRSGELEIPMKYSDANAFRNGMAPVENIDFWGYIDRSGRRIIPFKYDWASPFYNGRARVLNAGNWNYINDKGKTLQSFSYNLISHPRDKLNRFVEEGRIGYVNRKGRVQIESSFSEGGPFRQHLARASKNGKWGYVDREGKWIIPPKFELTGNFSGNLAPVKIDGKWTFLVHPRLSSEKDFEAVTNYLQDELDTPTISGKKLSKSLTEDYPEWRRSKRERYVSAWNRFQDIPRWNREALEPIEVLGSGQTIYEITKFPYQTPKPRHIDAVNTLLERTVKGVIEQKWYSYEHAREHGYQQFRKGGTHYPNINYLKDDNVLVPNRPETLIFERLHGRKILTGVMYYMSSRKQGHPQIGGPKMLWHFHIHEQNLCAQIPRVKFQADADKCDEEKWGRITPDMVHVWFVEHPKGFMATRMTIPDRLVKTSIFADTPYVIPENFP